MVCKNVIMIYINRMHQAISSPAEIRYLIDQPVECTLHEKDYVERRDSFNLVTAYAVKTPGTAGLGYFALSKAKTLSVNDASESEETLTGGAFFGKAVLVFVSVVTCTAHGTVAAVAMRALSWVNVVITPSSPSSVSRGLSREFRL